MQSLPSTHASSMYIAGGCLCLCLCLCLDERIYCPSSLVLDVLATALTDGVGWPISLANAVTEVGCHLSCLGSEPMHDQSSPRYAAGTFMATVAQPNVKFPRLGVMNSR